MFVVLQKKRIDILNLKLLATHPHPEELETRFCTEFQRAKIRFYLTLRSFRKETN